MAATTFNGIIWASSVFGHASNHWEMVDFLETYGRLQSLRPILLYCVHCTCKGLCQEAAVKPVQILYQNTSMRRHVWAKRCVAGTASTVPRTVDVAMILSRLWPHITSVFCKWCIGTWLHSVKPGIHLPISKGTVWGKQHFQDSLSTGKCSCEIAESCCQENHQSNPLQRFTVLLVIIYSYGIKSRRCWWR